MAGFTNKQKRNLLAQVYRRETMPANYYIVLVTSAVAPGPDTNTLGQLTEIAAGNGYTSGGYELNPDSTDFDFIQEDDTGDQGRLQIKNVEWTASGGPIPDSGNGARYAIMTDDNATQANREILHYWDLGADRTAQDGSPIRLVDLEIDLTEPA
jgi:hypothetical protein